MPALKMMLKFDLDLWAKKKSNAAKKEYRNLKTSNNIAVIYIWKV